MNISSNVTSTGTGLPSFVPGEKRQRFAADTACSSRSGSRDFVTLTSAMLPSTPMTTDKETVPWIPARIAAAVYCGLTSEITAGIVSPGVPDL